MKLPHLAPLIFAKEVLEKSDEHSKVLCEFEQVPKLFTFIEAAAQSSSSFIDPVKPMLGFLATVKNIAQHHEFNDLSYVVSLKLEAHIGEYRQFYFEAVSKSDPKSIIISGNFTVIIKEA